MLCASAVALGRPLSVAAAGADTFIVDAALARVVRVDGAGVASSVYAGAGATGADDAPVSVAAAAMQVHLVERATPSSSS